MLPPRALACDGSAIQGNRFWRDSSSGGEDGELGFGWVVFNVSVGTAEWAVAAWGFKEQRGRDKTVGLSVNRRNVLESLA